MPEYNETICHIGVSRNGRKWERAQAGTGLSGTGRKWERADAYRLAFSQAQTAALGHKEAKVDPRAPTAYCKY